MKKQKKQRLRRLAERVLARKQQRHTPESVTGIIRMAAGGYGFVTPENNSGEDDSPQEIFIPAKFVANAIDGDSVRIEILPPRKNHPEDFERGPVGKVTQILSRERDGFVGEIVAGNMVRPLNSKLPDMVPLHGARHGAKRGDWVFVKYDDTDKSISGQIRNVIGKAGSISADLDAVMAEYDLSPAYTGKENEEAMLISPREISRIDRRDLTVLTIDPSDAKDFDDALSIVENPDGTVELGVHIADVAAYITPKSKFDEAARLRAFSCYLPGRTLPMLPASLTAKISMVRHQDSLAHSVFLTVDRSGKVISARREHSIINVSCRMSYDEVQEFIDNKNCAAHWKNIEVKTLEKLVDITAKMRSFREQSELFINLPLPEIRVICDEKAGIIKGLEKRFSRQAENLVEECMLAANQAVGNEMRDKAIAGIYRVHPEVEAERSMEFSDMMLNCFKLNAGNIADRKECRRFIASLDEKDPKYSLILNLLLRAMSRAGYSVNGDIHFALGKTFYAHFTSPIRRYTDLTVHQQLWNFDRKSRTRSKQTLEITADWASEQEEAIDNACHAANDRLKLLILKEIMEKDPGRIYEGIVVRVMSSGLQVDVDEFGLYGFVARENLRRKNSLRSSDDPRKSNWKAGNFICLRLRSIDFARGSADFVPA